MRHFQSRSFSRSRSRPLSRCLWPARKTTSARSSRSRRDQDRSQKRNRRSSQSTLAFQSLEPRIAFAGLQAAPVPLEPQDMTVVGSVAYFTAVTAAHGRELWKTDGTAAGTAMIKDINVGTAGSAPRELTVVGNTLFFTADDGVSGRELWKSDGTPKGTVMVNDIRPGTDQVYDWATDTYLDKPASSNPDGLVAFNNQLFFTATDAVHGTELWKSDGTLGGTVIVKDVVAGEGDGVYRQNLIVSGSKLFFSSGVYSPSTGQTEEQLWSSDGTADGTKAVDVVTAYLYDAVSFGGRIYFSGSDDVSGTELWVSDGTEAGTMMLKDIAPGTSSSGGDSYPNSSGPGGFQVVGSTVYFVANDRVHGRELWKTDGTAGGTVLVRDIAAGTTQQQSLDGNGGSTQITVPRGSNPWNLTAFGTTLLFTADDGVNGVELWKSGGTPQTTVLVKDLLPGKNAQNMPLSSFPSDLTPYKGAMYFIANVDELWKTDGTTAGTVRVRDVDPDHGGDSGSGAYASMAVFNGTLLFADDDGVNGSDLWVSDGTSLGTQRLRTLVAAPVNKAPVGASKTVTMPEDGTYTFTAADFGFSDPSNTPANTLLAVKIATLPVAGKLTNNGVAVTAGAAVSAADIAAGKLRFAPAANASGATYASFTFKVQDNGGTANGGIDTDATARTMTVAVTPVNDAPTGLSKTVSMLKNQVYTFKVADFGFGDATDTPAHTLLAVKIATLPAAGKLTRNGVAVTTGTAVSASDIAAGLLRFTPAVNGRGNPYARFTFMVQDNGGTANGGIDTDPVAKTITIAVS